MTLNKNWDMNPIFAGGSQSPALADFLQTLADDLATWNNTDLPARLDASSQAEWVAAIEAADSLGTRLQHAGNFIACLSADNVKDEKAIQLLGQIDQLMARFSTLQTKISAALADQPDEDWHRLLETPALKPMAFHLNEQRDLVRQKMDPAREALATELATDGYHAWNRLYTVTNGDKEVQFNDQPISLGQLKDKFEDDPDRSVRQAAFELFEQAWRELAKTSAMALNYQAGFRLTLYKHRGWESVLKEPLLDNRLSQKTLDTMWAVIDAKSEKLLDYFAAKARLYGIDRLSWIDVSAPVGSQSSTFTYDSAADFVVDNIRRFNPDIADFCRHAIDNRWVEAEDRPGKQMGAFCASMPLLKESRVFMTYNGSYNGMLTLAHELGHGYHGWIMRDLPLGARYYAMSVAETASTFNELIVTNAGLDLAGTAQERLSILGAKLNEAAIMMMNIRARYDFERAFFAERAKKQLSVDELSDLMLSAQKTAFKDGLERYHPLFWASKLHFFITGAPFYNFPYTFGYLFSNGLYAQALAEGRSFQQRYINLLRDTGSMTTEALAQTHLGVDLTRPEFWETAVDRVLADVDRFVELVG